MRQYAHYDDRQLTYLFRVQRDLFQLNHDRLRRAISQLGDGAYGEAEAITHRRIEQARITACACLRRMRQMRREMRQRDELLTCALRRLADSTAVEQA